MSILSLMMRKPDGVIETLAESDEMVEGYEANYFANGLAALQNIRVALAAAGRQPPLRRHGLPRRKSRCRRKSCLRPWCHRKKAHHNPSARLCVPLNRVRPPKES